VGALTNEQISSWEWRLENFYYIVNKAGDLVKLKPNTIQAKVNKCRARRKMILKARQFGITTNEVIKQLDYVAFSQNKTACIMADEQGNMEKIFSKVRLAHEKMPAQFKPILAKGGGSKYELYFPRLNSKIFCDLQGRGSTIHWLHISEAPFCKTERVRATLEAVPLDGIVTHEGTANGMGGSFYKRWIKPSRNMKKLFYPWFFHPEYQMDSSHIKELTKDEKEFVKKAKRMFGVKITKNQIAFRRIKQEDQESDFKQEYAEDDVTCFLASGGAAVDLEMVRDRMNEVPEPISDNGTEKIFYEYDSSKQYALGADTAEGRGGDYSVGVVYEVRSRKEVAQIRSNRWRPREFAKKLYDLAMKYHKPGRLCPLMGVEQNNHGHAVLLELDEHLRYPNIYEFKEGVPGWKTDMVTRPLMIDTFIDGFENETIELSSLDVLGELLTLIDNNGKIEAESGENDDTVIAGAIALQMVIESSSGLSLYDDVSESILL